MASNRQSSTTPKGLVAEVWVKRNGAPYLRATIDEFPAAIGRDERATVKLDSRFVSRVHAHLERSGDVVEVVDTGSSNGLTVDGEKVARAVLSPRSTVRICEFEFRVRLTDAPQRPAGDPEYFVTADTAHDTGESIAAHEIEALDERAVDAPERGGGAPPPPESDLAAGWAEIEAGDRTDTNHDVLARRKPVSIPDGPADQSVMNSLATSPTRGEVQAAVGEDLDDEDADEYIRPNVDPLLKVLHRETAGLVPGDDDDICVEVIFAVGGSIEGAVLLRPGERYWWGKRPHRLAEPFVVPDNERFPLVGHTGAGNYVVQVPQNPAWKLFHRGKREATVHRSGLLMGIAGRRDEQVEVSYGPFTLYIRCLKAPVRVAHGRTLRAPTLIFWIALVSSTFAHAAAMLLPVSPLPELSRDSLEYDRFADYIATDLELDLAYVEDLRLEETIADTQPQQVHEIEAAAPAQPTEELDSTAETDSTPEAPPRQRQRKKNRRQSVQLAETEAGETPTPAPARRGLSVSGFKVSGMIDRLPTVEIDPARGPELQGSAKVLRGDERGKFSRVDKSGVGIKLTPKGRLERDEVRRVVNSHSRDIIRCQVEAKRGKPDLAGRLVMQWTVSPAGSVSGIHVVYDDMGAAELTACVKQALKTWKFPEPRGGPATVNYPFRFN